MQDRIRLCIILSHFPQGGAERQTLNLIKGLDPLKYDITLLLYASSEIFYKEVLALPIKLIINQATNSNKVIRNLKHAKFLRETLIKNTFDLVHTLLFHNGLWVRLLAPARYRGRILYSIRNALDGIPIYEKLAEKLLAGRSEVVTNSRIVLEQYVSLVGEKYNNLVHNIYNGIELNRFASDVFPAESGKIIIGTVGRQTSLKNQIQLLRAVKDISETNMVHLYIVGDKSGDSYLDNLKYVNDNRLEKTVTILDSQTNIETFYRRFNVFVLSSMTESCPNALFEAMLSRCLCLVSDGANSDNFIKDGINGLVYNGSLPMLLEKLNEAIMMIKNHSHYQIVNNGYEYVMKSFSYNSMISSYDDLYKYMLAKPGF